MQTWFKTFIIKQYKEKEFKRYRKLYLIGIELKRSRLERNYHSLFDYPNENSKNIIQQIDQSTVETRRIKTKEQSKQETKKPQLKKQIKERRGVLNKKPSQLLVVSGTTRILILITTSNTSPKMPGNRDEEKKLLLVLLEDIPQI